MYRDRIFYERNSGFRNRSAGILKKIPSIKLKNKNGMKNEKFHINKRLP